MGIFSGIGKALGGIAKGVGNFIGSAAGGNLLSAGVNLAGSLLGKSSVDSTNEANKAIASETNALQKSMFDQQLAYNTEMWNKNNEYNTPSAQMERYLAAGLNPYMMFGQNGGSGNSAAAAAGANAPQMHAAQMQAYDPSGAFSAAGSNIAAAARQQAEVDNIREDTQTKNIDNQSRRLKNLAEIEKLVADSKNSHTRAALQRQQYELMQATWNDTVRQAQLQTKSMDEQVKLTEQTRLGVQLDNKLKDIHLKYAPASFASQIAKTWSDVDVNRSVIGLNQASVAKLAQDVIESTARTNGINLNNKQIEQLTPILVEGAKYDNYLKDAELYRSNQSNMRDFDPRELEQGFKDLRFIGRFLPRHLAPERYHK